VRLAGYVLIELATGVSLAAGALGGAYVGARAFRSMASAAYAAEAPMTQRGDGRHVAPLPLERPLAQLASTTSATYFLGIKDEILLEPLRSAAVKRVKYNRGGSSISLRLDFEGGWRAAFKPDQTNEQTVPRKEIAAYRMSRLLGLESVSPAVGRAFLLKELVEKMDDGSRDLVPRVLEQTIVDEAGLVNGELSWWIPVIVDAKLENVPIDSIDGMTAWHKYLTVGAAEPYSGRALLPQISSMVTFDYLINNSDRWSGSNAKSSTDGKTLFYMDNTLSFGPVPEGTPKARVMLEHVQKFSRALIRRVRALDEVDVRAAMAADRGPYVRLLGDAEIAAVMFRREGLVQYVDGLIASYGEPEVLCYP
jgi:hypothetical protein